MTWLIVSQPFDIQTLDKLWLVICGWISNAKKGVKTLQMHVNFVVWVFKDTLVTISYHRNDLLYIQDL